MTILKVALLGSLRIVFMGSLKAALFVYASLLSDTAFADGVSEGNGRTASYVAPERSSSTSSGPVTPVATDHSR
ncbi:MAG TPA: hypothetical protein VMU78_02065 [Methylocella sp.]|nr:hypothetical protein [Methylocella sp.]